MRWLYLVYLMLFVMPAWSQPFYFKQYSTKDGLSSAYITDIAQDSLGFLWIASQDGLNRYDGYEFKTYKNRPNDRHSLNDNLIRSLHVDLKGRLWVGTRKGVCQYNPIKDNFTRLPGLLFGDSNTDQIRVSKILSDKRGDIWIALRTNGIIHYQSNKQTYRHYHEQAPEALKLKENQIRGIYYDENEDVIWLSTHGAGLSRIFLPEGRVDHCPHVNKVVLNTAYLFNIFRVCISQTCMFWLPNHFQVFRLNDNGQEADFKNPFTESFGRNIHDVLQSSPDKIWVGSNHLALYNVNKQEFIPIRHRACDPYSISADQINCLFLDHSRVLWVGTENGLNKLDTRQKHFEIYTETSEAPYRLPSDEVHAIYKDSRGILWIGLRKDGLYAIKGKQYKHIETGAERSLLKGESVTAFWEDSLEHLYIGTMGGGLNVLMNPDEIFRKSPVFQYFHENKESAKHINSWNIRHIAPDQQGGLWLSSNEGLFWVKFRCGKEYIELDSVRYFRHIPGDSTSLIGNLVNHVWLSEEGSLWVATSQGLSYLEKNKRAKGQFKNYFPKQDNGLISQNSIKRIFEDRQKRLWFCTQGGGLFAYRQAEDRFVNYTEQDGLLSSIIWGIAQDRQGCLWLSTNSGLSVFDPDNNIFKNYQSADGLQNIEFNEFSSFKADNGEMFFGGKNGMIRFFPDSIVDNPQPPKVVLTQLRIFNQAVLAGDSLDGIMILDTAISYKKKLILNHRHNDFTLEFAALHFAAPSQNHYIYILEGYDKYKKQTDGNKRWATYTNLPPGRYMFKVWASNNDGVWNKHPRQLIIEIKPPFWLTWWAYCFYIILIIALLLLLRHFVRLRHQWQSELEVDRIKIQFFTNISHEFRTPLTLILGPLENLLAKAKVHSADEKSLKLMKRNALRLKKLIDQLLDMRKLEQAAMTIDAQKDDIVRFVKTIFDMFVPLAQEKNYQYSFDCRKNSIQIAFDADKMEKVLINIIDNAFKYTPEGGCIRVSVEEEEKQLIISIKDNGIGIAPKEQLHIFDRFYRSDKQTAVYGTGIGLALSYELVKLHKGKLTVSSQIGQGACFQISIPSNLIPASFKEQGGRSPKVIKQHAVYQDNIAKKTSQRIDMENVLPHDEKPLIMIVDDNPDIRLYLRENLRDSYRIMEAGNGKTGLEKIYAEIPDLVISDVMMPEVDGNQLCKALKTDQRSSHIPVILLTARQSAEHQKEGLTTGADDYIPKPFNMELLLLRVHNQIENRKRIHRFFKQEGTGLNIQALEVSSIDKSFIDKVMQLINKYLSDEHFSVRKLADELAMSRTQLYRKLKALTGITPNELIRNTRLIKAAEMIKQTDMSISEIAYQTGFKELSHFSRSFLTYHGQNPSELRK